MPPYAGKCPHLRLCPGGLQVRCDNSVDSGCDVTRTNLTPSANRLFVSCLVFEENSFRAFPKLGGGKEREGGGGGVLDQFSMAK